MAVYKEERTNTWRVIYRYTDWNGERKQSQKRGFPTKREAQAWEREQLNQKAGDPDMTFASFVELYKADIRHQVNENTMLTKEHIIRTKLIPYFGKRRLSEITSKDVLKWQNEMIDHRDEKGKPYSPVYLRSLNAQLNAILNHAVKHYKLKANPTHSVRSMGRKQNREMAFWTKEEYLKFAEVMMDKPVAYYAFEMLYWCGIREGELLALTPSDFDLERGTVSITKSYQRIKGRDVIGPPKTEKGNRVIRMPDFLVDEMRDYLNILFQRVCGNAAHIHAACTGDGACGQMQIQLFGCCFCIFAVHLKEVAHLIQNNIIPMVMLDVVVVQKSRGGETVSGTCSLISSAIMPASCCAFAAFSASYFSRASGVKYRPLRISSSMRLAT